MWSRGSGNGNGKEEIHPWSERVLVYLGRLCHKIETKSIDSYMKVDGVMHHERTGPTGELKRKSHPSSREDNQLRNSQALS